MYGSEDPISWFVFVQVVPLGWSRPDIALQNILPMMTVTKQTRRMRVLGSTLTFRYI